MIGLVLVSHSFEIAKGTAELVQQMAAGELEVSAVGGDASGSLGTDPDRIRAAIEGLDAEVLVFMDIGSAVLSTETVFEMLEPEVAKKVRLVDAPFVEGALAAAVAASAGAGAEECVHTAMEARTEPKLHNEE